MIEIPLGLIKQAQGHVEELLKQQEAEQARLRRQVDVEIAKLYSG